MNNIYLYDDSFDSLLTLIMTLVYYKNNPKDIKSNKDFTPNLIDIPVYLELDKDKLKLLKSKVSNKIISIAYYVYLSNDKNKELIIYYFLKNALIYKDKVIYHRNLNCVNKALNLSSKVSREAHKLKGFLRFKEMQNNFFYAEISPDNNVIGILANHFRKRLSCEYWIIKDIGRNIYAFYDLNNITFLQEEDIIKLNLDLKNEEIEYEDLWKTFFNTIGIKSRYNPKTQMNFMPKKYWDYIIEMEDKK